LDGYIGLLQALPPSNMFSTTKFVNLIQMFDDEDIVSSQNSNPKNSTQTITIAATVMGGTAALMLVLTSTILFRRWTQKHKSNGSASGSKSGTSTLAGETFISRGSYQDDQMMRPICDKLYNDDISNRQ